MRAVLLIALILQPLFCLAQPTSKQEQFEAILGYALRSNAFNRLYPQEKVFLHFDNTAYFSGETIWFSANVVDATTGDTARSSVLYAELLSPTGVVLQQRKLKVVEGRCHGAFPLVDASVQEANIKRGVLGYPSGYYEVRAYTCSMLNFDAECHFSRVFPVYESPDKEGAYENAVIKKYKRMEQERPENKKLKALNMEFFPEGGHLVEGVQNRIAFKATDNSGRGGEIASLQIDGQQIPLSSMYRGMGYFRYVPKESRTKVKVNYKNKEHIFMLPQTRTAGYALEVDPVASDTLCICIRGTVADSDKLLGLVLMRAGKVETVDTFTLGTPLLHKKIAMAKFPTGVYRMTLLDAWGDIHASRMFFLNNGICTAPVSVESDKQYHSAYEKVEMQLSMYAEGVQHLSMAVRDATDYGTGYSDDIRTYMLLSSELRGYIEAPEYYFETNDLTHREALDKLMMVQGWSRYNIEHMQEPISSDKIHYTEQGLVLEGKVLHPRRDEPLVGIELLIRLFSPDRQFKQEVRTTSDENGYWGINLQDYEGEWDLNVQTYKDGKPIVTRLRLERSAAPAVLPYSAIEMGLQHHADTTYLHIPKDVTDTGANFTGTIVLDNVEVEGRRRYVDFCTFQAFNVAKDKELMLDKGEYTYNVSDYLRDKGYTITYQNDTLPPSSHSMYYTWLMEQCLINGFRTLWYVMDGATNLTQPSYTPGYDIDVADVKSVMVYDSPHSYMGNPEVLKMLDYSDIAKVQKSDRVYPPGMYVVEIHVYPKRNSPISWNRNTRQTTFDGYSPKMEFYSPQYPHGPIEGDADYRRTIYWNPDIELHKDSVTNITFYNNGFTKKMHVSISGLTDTGTYIILDE